MGEPRMTEFFCLPSALESGRMRRKGAANLSFVVLSRFSVE